MASRNFYFKKFFLLPPAPPKKEIGECRSRLREEVSSWSGGPGHRRQGQHQQGQVLPLLPPPAAVSALIDLSPGGSLMQSSRQDVLLAEQCPEQVQRELRALYLSLQELCRCGDPTDNALLINFRLSSAAEILFISTD